ncbi:hypothetical protein KGM_200371A, partial [Danaus plexippus plexippus]
MKTVLKASELVPSRE